uniref:Uncharacterized protein n=1 Tax=Chromera velia CCMP2878 TaxID=1169474 RepID=A0A0G4GB61_9ALVE|eukprot:Cvel_4417.t1-p1 / transcript=Cvel_4417.t1 / gene=Cvel_4417 / organism=Chromera_velia_CCMP2878 / gene_product=Transposon Ty3-G Gag-Pol polyprotein, putative / transcript_product=Transposon Ty3-G Gag-Pol polyprotein, putative / location=Cvel_scaffold192:24244-49360(+) / protein_length=659 / sequence_SO=supercontig / SO=protein_coding / is_pseudo=false
MAEFWRGLHKLAGTCLMMSSSGHPQTDGQSEIYNRTLETMLRCFCGDHQSEWPKLLPSLEFACILSTHSGLKATPHAVLYGFEARTFPSLLVAGRTATAAKDFHLCRQALLEEVKERLERANEEAKRKANQKRREATFVPGDWVLVHQKFFESERLPSKWKAKLSHIWYGPFEIDKKNVNGAICTAAVRNKPNVISFLMRRVPRNSEPFWPVFSAPFEAALFGHAEILNLFLDRGIPGQDSWSNPLTDDVLFGVAAGGLETIVQMLLDRGVDPSLDSIGRNYLGICLVRTAGRGQEEMVKWLVEEMGVDTSGIVAGTSALGACLQYGTEGWGETAEFLVQNGANLETNFSLHSIIRRYSGKKLRWILREVLKIGRLNLDQTGDDGITLLHSAVQTSNIDLVEMLLEGGANPKVCSNMRWGYSRWFEKSNVFCFAADTRMMDVLVKREADVNLVYEGNLALPRMSTNEGGDEDAKALFWLMFWVISRSSDATAAFMVDKLIARGIDSNKHLHHAARENNQTVVERLIAGGARPDLEDDKGMTALHHIMYKRSKYEDGKVEGVALLLNLGAQPDALDDRGQSPLYLAKVHQHTEIEEVLLRARGASDQPCLEEQFIAAHGGDKGCLKGREALYSKERGEIIRFATDYCGGYSRQTVWFRGF